MEGAVRSFLDFLAVERGFSANTIAAYRNDLSQFVRFVHDEAPEGTQISWGHVNRPFLLSYALNLREKGYASATAARKISALKSMFKFLTSEGIVPLDVAEGLPSPKIGRSLPNFLTVAEIIALLEQPAKHDTLEARRDSAMMELLYATGMRVSELVTLRLEDVSLNPQTPHVRCRGKGDKERVIPIHQAAVEALRGYLREIRPFLERDLQEQALFLNRRGQQLTRQGFWLNLKRYAKEARIKSRVTPHILRHSVATHLLASGQMDLRTLQELLGHANISSTQIYTHVTPEHLRQAYDNHFPRAR